MVQVDLDEIVALVHDVAQAVHVPRFGTSLDRHEKSPGELVSQVDREAEALLARGLAALAPGVPVLGEEAAGSDPSLLQLLDADAVWVVDPLDGTSHFLDGSPDHAVMVALVQRGETVASVVHQPAHARTYVAELGSGAWRGRTRLVREAVTTSDLAALRGAVLRRFLDDATRAAVLGNVGRFADLTPKTTCAGVEYPRIAEGEADFLLFWRTLPWDHAAGALLLTEAGGVAVRPDGSRYRPGAARDGLLAAADAVTAERVLTGLGLAG